MTPDESIFTNQRRINTSVTVANGEVLKARMTGDVRINLRGRFISMRDVLYVPELDANLLSITALNRRGFTVLFNKTGVEIKRENTSVAIGIMRGRTYLLRTADTALFTTEGGEAPISEESVGVISGAYEAPEKSQENPPASTNQTENAFRL